MSMQRTTVAVLLSTLTSPAIAAADFPKEGRFDYIACWSGTASTIEFSKGHSAFSFEMMGTTRTTPPGALFDKNAFRCVGTNASLGGRQSSITVCEVVDQDGDKRLSYFSLAADGKLVREAVTGTGKYAGMTQTSSVQPLGPFPVIKPGTFQNCNQQTGTYKLK